MIPLPKSLFFDTPHACSCQEAVALRRQLLRFGSHVRRPLRFAPPFVTFCPVIHLDLDRPQSVRTVCWPTLPRSHRARKSFGKGVSRIDILEGMESKMRECAQVESSVFMLTAELRVNTTMTKAWIARRLRMGTRWYLIWLLERYAYPVDSRNVIFL